MPNENIVTLQSSDGSEIQFVNTDEPRSGTMKEVYFSPDKSYVVAFYKKPLDWKSQDRLEKIVGSYRNQIFAGPEGDYWRKLFCWPTKIVKWGDKVGIVCPTYDKTYFFNTGRFKGQEKEGKWFASAKNFNRFIVPAHLEGSWFHRLRICIELARAVRRLHMAGLSHSDLSYKNVLVDPTVGRATVIDIDGLVVPEKFPPDVIGTPDFIAPEVKASEKEEFNKRILPSKSTDLHALAVLIYMYLLNRHPLRGGKVWDMDPQVDEALAMGEKAVFIEDPNNTINRPHLEDFEPTELPQSDINKRPYTICGPYLSRLFEQAFIAGLHCPNKRPTAQQWEDALIKTIDQLVPCNNNKCIEKWSIFNNKKQHHCLFCGEPYPYTLPVIDFYYSPKGDGHYQSENYRLIVYEGINIFRWHTNRLIVPNEKIKDEDKVPVADFQFIRGKWNLINRHLDSMYEILPDKTKRKIEKNTKIELKSDTNILLSDAPDGRLAHIILTNS